MYAHASFWKKTTTQEMNEKNWSHKLVPLHGEPSTIWLENFSKYSLSLFQNSTISLNSAISIKPAKKENSIHFVLTVKSRKTNASAIWNEECILVTGKLVVYKRLVKLQLQFIWGSYPGKTKSEGRRFFHFGESYNQISGLFFSLYISISISIYIYILCCKYK